MKPIFYLLSIFILVGCSNYGGTDKLIYSLSGVKLTERDILLEKNSECCSFTGDGDGWSVYEMSLSPKHKPCDYVGNYSSAPFQVVAFAKHISNGSVCVFDKEGDNSHQQVVIQGNRVMASWSEW
ncbi:MAG: hypothetical protein ACW7DN_17210 [Paraglaciecola chathamensis]|jgi:hypothetical protein